LDGGVVGLTDAQGGTATVVSDGVEGGLKVRVVDGVHLSFLEEWVVRGGFERCADVFEAVDVTDARVSTTVALSLSLLEGSDVSGETVVGGHVVVALDDVAERSRGGGELDGTGGHTLAVVGDGAGSPVKAVSKREDRERPIVSILGKASK
jgi:hypothetical protein